MSTTGQTRLEVRRTLKVGDQSYAYTSLEAAEAAGLGPVSHLPRSLKVLLENLLRHQDGRTVTAADIEALARWAETRKPSREIAYRPARVLMQDFTGVPGVVDLAAMRDAMQALGGDPARINPLVPVDLVIDHSVQVDRFATADALRFNVSREMERNLERYQFLRWGQQAFRNFRVVPPGTGICHQVNLEYLARVVWQRPDNGAAIAYPDTLVGTDSHTTMINALGVLGWGVGGIEAEAAMLGQPISMLIPEVVGVRLDGVLPEGATATDLVLTITRMLRAHGVVGKFVEYFGPGLDRLSLADRATIANMSPEYGATCGFFPIDAETLAYLRFTGRDEEQVGLVEAYAKAQALWRDAESPDPVFTDVLGLDMGTVEPSLAGPRRPQDRVALKEAKASFATSLGETFGIAGEARETRVPVSGTDFALHHGDVVIAAITSCTNTSNPSVMVGAGLLARKARARGLRAKPWVKTSLAPGSKVVSSYLAKAGLQEDLDGLGFNLVGYGCTTCIGNSGPLPEPVVAAIEEGGLVACAVLSGNRNFEGRISPHVRANYLASPPLVVAYALAGTLRRDLSREPLAKGADGKPVYLRDVWPSSEEVRETIRAAITPEMFRQAYADVFAGSAEWQAIEAATGITYAWDEKSTYARRPPFFDALAPEPEPLSDIENARILALLGDSITTDHISPAGAIKAESPAGRYLIAHGVAPRDFNSYGARRGNHEVMMRGTFANVRLKNEMVPGREGGFTRHLPSGEVMAIFDAAMRYQTEGTPLVVVAGREYGSGSSRDWAAKGTRLLGIRAVIAESFERIHRSNLIGMGVLPVELPEGVSRKTLGLDGEEEIDIAGLAPAARPKAELTVRIRRAGGATVEIEARSRIDTAEEAEYFRHGGILHYVLRQLARA